MRAGILALLLLLLCAGVASGHAERATFFPDRSKGAVPKYRTTGKARVVCKADSGKRVRRIFARQPKVRKARLALLKRCRYRHVQAAVDAARSGNRILILPGVYKERPSRRVPFKDPKCSGEGYWESSGDQHQADGRVPTYLHQVECPNSLNLVAVIGDSLEDADRECDRKCNLLMMGMGKRPLDVRLVGDRIKMDVLRVDRADGFQLRNISAEQGAYNNIDFVETNGFLLKRIVTRWAHHYGILTFTSDHGLYDRIEAYGAGDSGVYPGSGPEAHCKGYGIEVRRVNSYGNTLGASGTAGNGTWTHHSRFHGNAAGIAVDSFAPGHPGMPQDCSKWTDNRIHSNNVNFFDDANETYCNRVPFKDRPKRHVCPRFSAVVGAGFMFYGINDNVITRNFIYDQHRNGIRMFGVPAALRGEPAKGYDTSHGNRITGNTFGIRPDGTKDRNGLDVFWDEQGLRNCWEGNRTADGGPLTSDPPSLPTCASGGSTNPGPNLAKLGAEVSCASWDPETNPDPPGCSWFTTPPDPDSPQAAARRAEGDFAELRPVWIAPAHTAEGPDASARGPLTWDAQPEAVQPVAAPNDRVVAGRVRNTGSAPLALDATSARLLDDAGNEVRGTVSFAAGYSHGLYPPDADPAEPMPDFQARRMGFRAEVAAGDAVPFTVAWRAAPGQVAPTRVDLGVVTVALPAAG